MWGHIQGNDYLEFRSRFCMQWESATNLYWPRQIILFIRRHLEFFAEKKERKVFLGVTDKVFLGICGGALAVSLTDSFLLSSPPALWVKVTPHYTQMGKFLEYSLIKILALSNLVSSFISFGHSFQILAVIFTNLPFENLLISPCSKRVTSFDLVDIYLFFSLIDKISCMQ